MHTLLHCIHVYILVFKNNYFSSWRILAIRSYLNPASLKQLLPILRMDYEVIVVGAGIQGSATAYYLASRGTCNVLLLEQVAIFTRRYTCTAWTFFNRSNCFAVAVSPVAIGVLMFMSKYLQYKLWRKEGCCVSCAVRGRERNWGAGNERGFPLLAVSCWFGTPNNTVSPGYQITWWNNTPRVLCLQAACFPAVSSL